MTKVNTDDWGLLNGGYLAKMEDTVGKGLSEYPRLMALSVILRYPENCEHECNTASTVITDFIRSLKSQITALNKNKEKMKLRVYPCRIRYLWVREFRQDETKKHYHIILLFNKDAYAFPGNYRCSENFEASSLAGKIMEAWMRALKINKTPGYWKYYTVVEFPDQEYRQDNGEMVKNKCYFHLDKNSPDFQYDYEAFLPRLEYLAKEYSKINDDGQRNFGRSQY